MNPARYPMRVYHPYAFAEPAPSQPRVVFVSIQREAPPVIFAAGPMELLQSAFLAGGRPRGAWLELCQEPLQHGESVGPPAPRMARRTSEEAEEAEFEDMPPKERDLVEPLLAASLVRQLPFGEFRRLLEPQLKSPESIGENAAVTCAIQVYEAPWPLQPVQLAAAVFGQNQPEGQFTVLTRALAERLRLTRKVPPRPDASAIRYLHVIVLDDPTGAARPTAGAPAPEKRTSIPERYLKPWEFRLSREEVLYDMHEERSRRGFAALWARMRRWRRASADLRRWQALLQGRTPEDQLWAVRPPACAFHDPEVRQWVSQLLLARGYQAERMLDEWEIYWRRKAV
ncbi:MAG: hypothetical protein RMK33_00095 [Arcobacter sp.]|nr:hypothetical protein [Bryobacteraceae bacterium]MDW8434547.1 hypothetical protein [Arcobacter sp.]